MTDLLQTIAMCIERGKVDASSPHPPDLKGENGADELTLVALSENIEPEQILYHALVPGMEKIGSKFAHGEAYIPDLLMSAKAMNAAMKHIEPFFSSGKVKTKGVFVVGTVQGDLHDIGKNLVAMVVKGGGWEVLDLGVNVPPEKFVEAVESHPGCAIGLSALLTTTMPNMQSIVTAVREKHPETRIIIGGAPITEDYARKIGANAYSRDPQGAVAWLNS